MIDDDQLKYLSGILGECDFVALGPYSIYRKGFLFDKRYEIRDVYYQGKMTDPLTIAVFYDMDDAVRHLIYLYEKYRTQEEAKHQAKHQGVPDLKARVYLVLANGSHYFAWWEGVFTWHPKKEAWGAVKNPKILVTDDIVLKEIAIQIPDLDRRLTTPVHEAIIKPPSDVEISNLFFSLNYSPELVERLVELSA